MREHAITSTPVLPAEALTLHANVLSRQRTQAFTRLSQVIQLKVLTKTTANYSSPQPAVVEAQKLFELLHIGHTIVIQLISHVISNLC